MNLSTWLVVIVFVFDYNLRIFGLRQKTKTSVILTHKESIYSCSNIDIVIWS